MFEWLGRKAKIYALKKGLKRKAPQRFSYSSKTDFFVSFLTNSSTGQEILLNEIGKNSFSGVAWNGERFDSPVTFPLKELDSWSFKTKRFYGYDQIEYSGLSDFVLSEASFLPQRLYFREWISQKLYNYRTNFRHDRTDVLRKLIDVHLTEARNNNGILFTSSAKSVVALLTEVHGNRVYGHPNCEEVSARFRLVLESLAATGELEKQNTHEFRLNASAVASISNYELEERRHHDSVKQNWLLLAVTVVMAVAAVFQTFAALKQ